MKNGESISNNQDNQATNEWEQTLGNYSKNEPTAMDYMREDLEDLERSNHYGRLESDYDDKIKARAKAIQAERDFWKNAPKTALDYAKEDLDELEGDNYYGQLRTDYDKKMKERDERIAAERAAWENAKPTALAYMKEDLEDLQYSPLESGEGTSPSPSKGSKPQMIPKSQATQHPKQPIKPKVSTFPANSQDKSAEPTTDHTSFESDHLKWPEETFEQQADKAMDQANSAIEYAEDTIANQGKKHAKNSLAEQGNDYGSIEYSAEEAAKIERTIAEMAYSGDEKLVNLMRQKEYESEDEHRHRLVMMAKTEMKWRELKKSIEDARKHMKAENEALARTRASLIKTRQIANSPRQSSPSSEPKPSKPDSFIVQEQKNLKKDLANNVRDMLKKSKTTNSQPAPTQSSKEESSEKASSAKPNAKSPETSTGTTPKSSVQAESESQPERKILQKDLKDVLRAKIAEREASSSTDTKAESESQPERKILQKDLKDVLRAKIAEREALEDGWTSSDSSSRHLEKTKSDLAEYQRRIEHVDDSLNAERDKLMEERSPSIRRKLTKIFASFTEKRKEKARKRTEKRQQEANESWF